LFIAYLFGLGPLRQVWSGAFTGIFTRESSYCFQCVLAIAILSVRLFVHHTGGSVKNGAS